MAEFVVCMKLKSFVARIFIGGRKYSDVVTD